MKVNLLVKGNIICSKNEYRGRIYNENIEMGGGITCLGNNDIPSYYDVSDAIIIDGDICCNSISYNSNIVCTGIMSVKERGGYYASF